MTTKKLVELVGTAAAAKLIEHCGGKPLYIPSPKAATSLRRNKEIYDKRLNFHMSIKKLAVLYDLTEYSVRRIIHEQRRKRERNNG